MGDFDRSSKWLIQHHGDALLRLAGVRNVVSWRALQAELVQPAQLPDGVLEAALEGGTGTRLYVLEIATYPEQRAVEQLCRDTLLTYLTKRVLPEVLVLVLHPKGQGRIPASLSLASEDGWAGITMRWKVVELWTLPAEELLATGDPGLMPWVPLTQFEGPPEPILRQCREVIDREALSEERPNLLAVTQVLTRLRYNDVGLLSILGGSKVMIESPLITELVTEAEERGKVLGEARGRVLGGAEATRRSVLRVLRTRFGEVPEQVEAALERIEDESRLEALVEAAAGAVDLEAFRRELSS